MVGSLRIERDQIRPAKSNENSHDSLLVLPGLLRSIQPIYPEEARWEGSAGKVTLMFHISQYGDVTDVKVQTTSGHVDLDHAA